MGAFSPVSCKIQPIITRRAYSGYCLGVVGERAAQELAYAAFPELLRRAFRNGSPRLSHVLPYLAYWLLPHWLLRQLRASLRGSGSPETADRLPSPTVCSGLERRPG